MVQLEVGKFYRDDRGTVWGPLKRYGRDEFCVAGEGYRWNADGSEVTHVRPLIEEAPDPRYPEKSP